MGAEERERRKKNAPAGGGKGGGEMNVKVRTDESERGLDRESGRGRFEITYIPFLVTPG